MDAGEHPVFGDLLRQHRQAAGLTQQTQGLGETLHGISVGPPVLSTLEETDRIYTQPRLLGQVLLRQTCRVVLRLQGEHDYEVPTLELPPAGYQPSLEVDRYEGIHLFAERAARAGFRITTENGPAVIELCRRLDGLPLAIVLILRWPGSRRL